MATVREEKTKIINMALRRLRDDGFAPTASYSGTLLDFDTPSNNTNRVASEVVETFDEIVKEVLTSAPWGCVSKINNSLTQDTSWTTDY